MDYPRVRNTGRGHFLVWNDDHPPGRDLRSVGNGRSKQCAQVQGQHCVSPLVQSAKSLVADDYARKSDKDVHLSLVALMAYFCDCDATNDKNRFYGLAGLSSNNHGFDVDYSLGAEEVYLRFAKSFITQHNSLDTISFAVIFVTRCFLGLPTGGQEFNLS